MCLWSTADTPKTHLVLTFCGAGAATVATKHFLSFHLLFRRDRGKRRGNETFQAERQPNACNLAALCLSGIALKTGRRNEVIECYAAKVRLRIFRFLGHSLTTFGHDSAASGMRFRKEAEK